VRNLLDGVSYWQDVSEAPEMARSYLELRVRMSLEAQKRSAERARAIMRKMALAALMRKIAWWRGSREAVS
jgi:hypothetical protein